MSKDEMDLKNETKRLERATLDIEKLKVNYWSLWQECGEIRKEIEGLNRKEEEKMTNNEAGNTTKDEEMNAIMSKSLVKKSQKFDKYVVYTWPASSGKAIPPEVLVDMAEAIEPENCIDELIARHKATLDLLVKPAYPKTTPFLRAALDAENLKKIVDAVEKRVVENYYGGKTEPALSPMGFVLVNCPCVQIPITAEEPAECGCIDKAAFLEEITGGIDQFEQHINDLVKAGNVELAGEYDTRVRTLRGVRALIDEGRFDRAPCKPEPAQVGTKSASEEKRAPTKPALDKGDILDQIEHLFFEIKHDNLERSCIINAAHILHDRIKCGAFDLPSTPISTPDLVELLRSRASLADGIDVTDLEAGELLNIGGNKPMTVIAVRKEDRS